MRGVKLYCTPAAALNELGRIAACCFFRMLCVLSVYDEVCLFPAGDALLHECSCRGVDVESADGVDVVLHVEWNADVVQALRALVVASFAAFAQVGVELRVCQSCFKGESVSEVERGVESKRMGV